LIDSWYSTAANLQVIDSYGWLFVCGLKSNRWMHVLDGANHVLKKLSELAIPEAGAIYARFAYFQSGS
jgi:hypothetical protein